MKARVQKSYGTSGEVVVSISAMPEDIEFQGPVYIDFDGLPVPFFIEKFIPRGGTKAVLKFEDIDTMAAAEEIVGREIYTLDDNEQMPDDDGEGIDLAALDGFTVKDAENRLVGTVDGFYDIPNNPCLNVVRPDGSEILVPLHDDLLLDYKPRKKVLRLEIPEGL